LFICGFKIDKATETGLEISSDVCLRRNTTVENWTLAERLHRTIDLWERFHWGK